VLKDILKSLSRVSTPGLVGNSDDRWMVGLDDL